MRTARSSSRPGGDGGLHQAPPGPGTPPDQALPGSRHPPGADSPGTRHPPEQIPLDQAPPGTRHPPCEQNDRQVQKYYLASNFVCGR